MQALQQKQLASRQLREVLSGSQVTNNNIEERVERCKNLQYNEHKQLFAVLYSSIHKAAADNSVSGIKYFLSLKQAPRVHVDDFDKNGVCPIHLAAERGCLDAVKFLVDSGCNVDVRSTYGNTAMMYACKENKIEILKLLFELGAKLTIKNKAGFTPVHFAAQCDNVEILSTIVEMNSMYHLKRMEMLLEEDGGSVAPVPQRRDDDSLLSYFSSSNSPLDVETQNILNQPSNNLSTPLHLACHSNSQRAVEFLIQCRVKIDAQDTAGDTPLHIAGRKNLFPIFRLLIAAGASDSIKNCLHETPAELLKDDIW